MRLSAVATPLLVLGAAALCTGGFLTAARAVAVWQDLTTVDSMPGHLVLESTPDQPRWLDARPGEELYWTVTAALHDVSSGSLELDLEASGSLVEIDGLLIEVSTCDAPYTGDPLIELPRCPSVGEVVQAQAPLASVSRSLGGNAYQLEVLRRNIPRHLLVVLTLPADTDPLSVANGSARIGIGLSAAALTDAGPESPMPGPGLAGTGVDAVALGVLGAGIGAVAAGIFLLRREHSASHSSEHVR